MPKHPRRSRFRLQWKARLHVCGHLFGSPAPHLPAPLGLAGSGCNFPGFLAQCDESNGPPDALKKKRLEVADKLQKKLKVG